MVAEQILRSARPRVRGLPSTHAHPATNRGKMKLTDEVFRSFRVAKVFRENTDRVNCLDFSANGDTMISSSNDDSIVIYCCVEGRCALFRPHLHLTKTISIPRRPKRTLYSKKYGCDLLQYTHAPNTIVYSSNKVDGEPYTLSLSI